MRVVVTGGAGFIGSAVCEQLRLRGMSPVAVDLPGFDVRKPFDLQPDTYGVIHVAGVLGTHELFDTPELAVDVNVKGTLNVLDAAHQVGARFVGITMPQSGWVNVYNSTKFCATRLATAWHRHRGLPVSHVRAFNAFGPGQHHGPGHPQKIVPTFAAEAWAGRPIPIWGSGEQTVDLVYVDDVARMMVDALEHGDDITFDAGTAQPFTVLQVARMVLDITGSKAGVTHLPMRDGEDGYTEITATGEGWDRLDWKPEFDPALFERTVQAYR